MFKQGKKILLGAGVLAALGFGGSALSAAGAAPVTPTVEQTSSVDRDQIQSGDQTAPDTTTEAPGTETLDASQGSNDGETQDASQESSGSEVSNNDGPGGHADEPGNPNADHQASGQQE